MPRPARKAELCCDEPMAPAVEVAPRARSGSACAARRGTLRPVPRGAQRIAEVAGRAEARIRRGTEA
eukprot:2606695-Prymnesium_polylepis.1